MFCRKCGSQITEGSKFCNKCGEPVSQPAAQVQQVAASNTSQTEAQQPKQYNDYATAQLFEAVKSRSVDKVQQLIANGANVNITDADGWTPLMFASYCNLEMVQTLLAAGAIVGIKSKVGQTARSLAQANSTIDKNAIIELLQKYENGNVHLGQGQTKTAVSGMYCGKCGTDVAPGVKFCPKCGNPLPQENSQDTTTAASAATPANAQTPEAGITSPTAPVADASVSAEVATVTDTATSAESLETSTDTQASETQTQAPKAKRTIRIITPTGEITFATEESVFDGEYVLEVHRDDELLGSAKIDVE